MTGNNLAKAIREAKGKVLVPVMVVNDVAYIYVEKASLIEWAREIGEGETFMTLERTDDEQWALTVAN
jgi:uncharacterized Fe-S cluster-containing radical SAM superfamily enzyme